MKNHTFSVLFGTFISTALLGASFCASAATADIANAPLASASSTVVKPNVMFILDDSGSMSWGYLPDSIASRTVLPTRNCYKNSSYNRIYYDPNTTYTPPVDSAGTSLGNANFTAARYDGLNASSALVNLSTSFLAWDTINHYGWDGSLWSHGNDTAQAAYYHKYSGTVTLVEGTCYPDTRYTAIIVSSTSGPGATDERTNFANWYSYYRTRMQSMKSSASRAFKDIVDNYRVGYTTHSYTGTNSSNSEFQSLAPFNYVGDGTGQKERFYTKLFAATPDGGTPLRAALSKIGRMYAGKLLTGANDPVEYSCQQNFALLSTDGYWNGDAGYMIDGTTAIGNQDATAAAPMKEGLTASNTLADVAMYYYKTDLRTTALGNCTGALGGTSDVCDNNVLGAGLDINPQQHMTTFSIGLGVSGALIYTEDYLSAGSGHFFDIKNGTRNWPIPVENTNTTVDDLWHAAVNGRGTYFSAQNPASLVSGLSKALAGISALTGSASAAATSNLQPVAGDNFAYLALYRTVFWDGDLQAKTIDLSTGAISATATWSAQPLLDAMVYTARNIYTFDSATTNKLKLFTYAGLSTAEKAHFDGMCGTSPRLSQCASLTTAQQTAVSGTNLVNFIRGHDGFENQATNTDKLYRDREHVLGDMVNSQPVYLKAPSFNYVDTNYDTYKNTTEQNRAATVYVAVNDGMLHAFDGATGAERWAYIPPLVMNNLHKLADMNYSSNHRYYVDGSPVIVDACLNTPPATCTGAQWKSILVGGLNAGGRGYYALDITSPTSPKALWNFTVDNDADLGFTYGNPVITKMKTASPAGTWQAGQWVVIVSSGYNNVSPGDGKGYLYILDAATGAKLQKISTNVGSTTTPSGLGKINAWIENGTDNTAERIYAGDLLGNVWRFDINDIILPAGNEALLLAELGQINGAGTQSITTRPELALITYGGSNYPVVMVGTGRYLGISDLSDTSKQSVYAIKDSLTATGLGNVRTTGVLVAQTLTKFLGASNEELRTTSTNPVDWSTKSGWYIDLDPSNKSPGERVNVDMNLQLGILTVAGNVPNANACTVGGYAWLYYFNINSGQYLSTSANGVAGERLGSNALIAGVTQIKLASGAIKTIVTNSDGTNTTKTPPPPPPPGQLRRVGWRELIN